MYPALVGLVTIVAAILRLHDLAAKSFWLDEGISVQIARLPWPQLWFVLRHREANMALYYLLLRFWLMIGSTEGFIRGLSVLASVATLPFFYALGARLFGRATGLVAVWLMAISAFQVRFAQEARGYALVVLFTVVASWLLVRNLQEPSSAQWGAYAAACALAAYSHFFGGFVIIAHGASLAFLPHDELPWRDLGRAARWFVYMVIPIAAVVGMVGAGSTRWIPQANAHAVLNFFVVLCGNGGNLLVLLEGIAAAVAAFAMWSECRGGVRTRPGWTYAFAFALLFVPLLVVLAVSMVTPIFLPRYMSPCLPGLLLIVAAGIVKLRRPVLVWILGAAITAVSLLGTFSYYRKDFDMDRDDWRDATSYVLERALPGDGVFFYQNFGHLPFEFYRSLRHPAPVWPEALVSANHGDWAFQDSLFAYLADALQDAGPGGDRVWLVLDLENDANGKPRRESTILRAVYGKGRHLVDQKRISRITILLYARDAAGLTPANSSMPGK